ncbi:UDP-N-acetyl-D-mannosamine dehydrogenase [Geofilum rubicundum]|uniref:UDP-glucose dehydrogenase n=1 Tax=Geofilum rubicundum JCM 15548 TaxID=1236989 RepID=A0A0E9LTB5_9BACT|nr:UDP-N-acetyl-D-mannosamine dehydrogenase [Geofilum rubicundum]GAO28533.1 UDP-glucose dehydrogenase [Geofilum rubicundum JCM 15548]
MNSNTSKRVSVVGMGYIGLPTAAAMAGKGIEVLGCDINPEIVDIINQGKVHIIEPDLDELVKKVVSEKKLRVFTSPQPADVYMVVVPTPFKQNHQPDISFVEQATRSVIPHLKAGDLFIIESTSPVMTTEKMAAVIFEERPELKEKISIAYCPERVLPGKVLYELEHNDRVIGGIDEASTQKAAAFYALFVQGKLHATNARTAEMCKLVENSSRDVQIAFANELSMICDNAGVDVWELIALANKHPRVNILQPGCGVGGHCIAVDPWFIVSDYPEHAHVIKQAREINDYKSEWCIKKIIETSLEFEVKNGRLPVIACMGLAFKPDIDDLRESPAKYIASRVIAEARGEVLICEPNIESHSSFTLSATHEAYEKADIVAWLVKHKAFTTVKVADDKEELDFCGLRTQF